MLKNADQILADIDSTLDQLICNAEVISLETLSVLELEAMQKTQESLLARVVHMDELMDAAKKRQALKKKQAASQLEEKIVQFSHLNQQFVKEMSKRFKTQSKRSLRQSNIKNK
jgi:hypothetical protein